MAWSKAIYSFEYMLSGNARKAISDGMAQAVAHGQEDDVIRLCYQAVPVGWLSKLLWRFVHYRIERAWRFL